MNRYLKLFHMEVHRFRWMLAILMGITAACQISALIWTLTKELYRRREPVPQDIGNTFQVSAPEQLTFEWAMANNQLLFILPILICISVLALYIFFIWYRDWIGRHTFIYRLLVLPTARRNLYLAKISAFLLFVFGFVSFQLVLMPILNVIFKLIVPADQRADSHIVDAISRNLALVELIPRQFEQFLYYYGMGTIAVLAIFTAILLERSYRRLGILYGVLYLSGCVLAVMSPSLLFDSRHPYLYPNELYAAELIMFVFVLCISVWLGIRLLAKKITV
ncbi:hypothetical protein [Paenibacillus prosopidis]|uniref:ABC-2 family transporter n=1 Tax=Paenibacillus prosopidis TaxID=630520 RepID=A0A368W5M3_9BACL|nr:hypothetical protein [Paenibacillus prosopidis]RCW47414.1 hypothetical protein DFP97_10828 [Paenibacillus prosopidis]